MKKLMLITFCALCLAAYGQDEGTRGLSVLVAQKAGIANYDPARFHALLIGIDQYQHWPGLRTAVNDVNALAEALVTHYGFIPGQVRKLLNEHATRENILTELERLAALGPEDSALIYYAGHGWMDERKNGFWVPVDALEDRKFDYVSNAQIVQECFKKYRMKHLLVISDSCFSGTLLRGRDVEREDGWEIPSGFQKPSRWVMTSGDLAPVPDDTGVGHSPFALRMLQFLRYGDEPVFGIYDLFGFVRRTLKSGAMCQPLDTPAHMPGGEFVLARVDMPDKRSGRTGGLLVETSPPGALVRASGYDIQRSPHIFRTLPAGPLTVRIELADYETETRQVIVPANDFATLTLELKRQTGSVIIESSPPKAEVWDGDRRVGETPCTITLEAGARNLVFKAAGHEDRPLYIQVAAGQTIKAVVDLPVRVQDPEAVRRQTLMDDALVRARAARRDSGWAAVLAAANQALAIDPSHAEAKDLRDSANAEIKRAAAVRPPTTTEMKPAVTTGTLIIVVTQNKAVVTATDANSRVFQPDSVRDGSFSFVLPAGSYAINIACRRFKPHMVNPVSVQAGRTEQLGPIHLKPMSVGGG